MKKVTEFTFLIVDDVPNMRRTIRNMLNRMGVKKAIIEADDGERAWEKLQFSPVEFIICDWNMPRMNGIQLLRKMRKDPKFANIPFLMLTGEIDESTIAQAAETEIDAYIIKPFIMKTLMDKMEEALKRRYEPSEAEQLFRQGLEAMKNADPGQAFSLFEQVRLLSPKTAKVYVALGDVYLEQQNREKAKEMFEKAINLSRQYAQAMDRLAELAGMEGDVERMADLLKRAVEISPEAPRRQLNFGKALLATGKKDQAILALETSLKQAPEDPYLAREAGEAFLAADLNDQASKAFQKAINLNPAEIETYNRLGIAFRKQKRYLDAIKAYQKALMVDPANEVILYNISIAYFHQGLRQETKKSLERLLAINPRHAEAQKALRAMNVENAAGAR